MLTLTASYFKEVLTFLIFTSHDDDMSVLSLVSINYKYTLKHLKTLNMFF